MEEIHYSLALHRLLFNSPQTAMRLYREAGTAEAVYLNRGDIKGVVRDVSDDLIQIINCDWNPLLEWSETELEWCSKKSVRALCPSDDDYPHRLDECVDAPLVLFYRGTADLNAPHIVSIVGTRSATSYGQDMVERLVHELGLLVPDVVVLSGLAYGIDVCGHRCALVEGLQTVGVVAHGMDMIYPAAHRGIAVKMLSQGGLLTEYPSRSRVDKLNFLRRNRIVAGVGDAVIVAESKRRGGSLSTARIANEYGHPVLAFPGRVGDDNSEGCNMLIRDQNAQLITSAQDVLEIMGWQSAGILEKARQEGIQSVLFPDLTDDERLVVDVLSMDDFQQNVIAVRSGLPIGRVSSVLFTLELKGVVKCYAGGAYHLVR